MITLGADVGGKDAHEATHPYVLGLRRLLEAKTQSAYGGTVKELALVLRIDGSVQAWHRAGIENLRFSPKQGIATVDLFMPMDAWRSLDAGQIRRNLAVLVVESIEKLVELLEARKVEVDSKRLQEDVALAVGEYLRQES